MHLLNPLYEVEIYILHVLQQLPCFSGLWEPFWLAVTKLGDPAWTFVVYFPIVFPFAKELALQFLLSGAVSEFLNGIFKWILHGERPYWYIKTNEQNQYVLPANALTLKQFKFTCETGPGSPSGHAMVTASVFYVILFSVSQKIVHKNGNGQQRLSYTVIYICLLVLVSISRLYIAAHFPHQVLLGIALGFLVGYKCSALHPVHWSLKQPLLVALTLVVFGSFSYWMLILNGFDPDWSIEKAKKFCERSDWIHLSTTPLSALIRDISALLGMGIALKIWRNDSIFKFTDYNIGLDKTVGTRHKILHACLNLAIAQTFHKMPLPQSDVRLFYATVSVFHMILPVLFVCFFPVLISQMIKMRKEK